MPDTKDAKPSKVATKTAKREKDNKKRVEGLKRFFVETKAEFKKIVWPAPKQVLNNTIVVIVMILVVGALIWCLDALSSSGLNAFLKTYGGSV